MDTKGPRLTGLWIIVIATALMMGWMVADVSGAFKTPPAGRIVTTAPQPAKG